MTMPNDTSSNDFHPGVPSPAGSADPALLVDLLQASSEAIWCIEFTEPVDLAAPEHEILRQIFTNERRWAFCNKAMARLYDVPDDVDFSKQPVATYFHRSKENESFVRRIIESGFNVDNASSIDVRHDGAAMFVENSVRARILDHKLTRLWGTVRDITGWRRAADLLEKELADIKEVLAAVPFALAVINARRELIGLNAGFERLFDAPASVALGQSVHRFLALDDNALGGMSSSGAENLHAPQSVKLNNGRDVEVILRTMPFGGAAPGRMLLVMRELDR